MTGEKCFHHAWQDAVVQCKKCENFICGDCRDMYRVEDGSYAGGSLCYDCVGTMVKDNSTKILRFRDKVTKERILSITGAIVGILVATILFGTTELHGEGISQAILIPIGGILGGSIASLVEAGRAFKRGDAPWGILCIVGAPIIAVKTIFFDRKKQLKQCNESDTQDAHTIRVLRDHFAYVQFANKNDVSDIAKLTAPNGKLNDNTYAKEILDKGEESAKSDLHKGVVQVAANSVIIDNLGVRQKKS